MRIKYLLAVLLIMLSFSAKSQNDNVGNADNYDTTQYSRYLVPDYEILAKVINDPTSNYYYPTLLKRFSEADTSLSLEEIHCLYYGYVLQDDYNPYVSSTEEDEARKILNQEEVSVKDAEKAIKLLDKAVEKTPMHMRLYMYRYFAKTVVYGEGSKESEADAYRYVALVSVISASGDGYGYETALHVCIVSHSYSVMSYYGLDPTSQSLQMDNGRSFDVFTLEENEMGREQLYVDVTPCLSYLSKRFAIDDDEESVSDKPVEEYDISLGRKVTVKMDKKSKGKYLFRVLSDVPFKDTVDYKDTERLFEEKGEKNTIVFYFVNGKMGDNPAVLLIMKSYCKKALSYDTFIRMTGNATFNPTSNDGIFPSARGVEIWRDPIAAIRLSGFRPMK